MNKIKIITDSCADMDKDLRDKYDIDYAKMEIVWDGVEKPASCDWDLYTVKELYGALRKGARITTAQVPDQEFERVFGMYLERGYDIVYVACSTGLSGSYNVGRLVAKRMAEKYPEQTVLCVDTKISSGGEAIVAIEAAKAAAQGLDVNAVAEVAQKVADKSMQFATVGELTYLKRAGRVKASSAFFGNLFGIKPILISNKKGENEAVKKVKGRKNSLDTLVDMLAASIGDAEYPASEQTVFVYNADCIADSDYLVEQVKAKINPKDVVVGTVGPTVGASAGPDTIMLYALGNQYATLGE